MPRGKDHRRGRPAGVLGGPRLDTVPAIRAASGTAGRGCGRAAAPSLAQSWTGVPLNSFSRWLNCYADFTKNAKGAGALNLPQFRWSAATRLGACLRPQVAHKNREGDTQRSGKPSEDIETGIAPSTLDPTDVGPVEVCALGKLFLRQPHSFP